MQPGCPVRTVGTMTTAAPTAMKICVFLSAADLDEHYTRPARELAELLGKGVTPWCGVDPIPG